MPGSSGFVLAPRAGPPLPVTESLTVTASYPKVQRPPSGAEATLPKILYSVNLFAAR
ncbi:protein of unknown function (plasmid) [Azospirillum baldaniorum]|uniref:Uncharacterized protein n=1 Tax=Azospirillum baldaniorum TaxID=1064539 RepID=A0A9P1NPX9_9PROT|nr:protein of unknown function [Azospirillum baldaniorum]